MWRSSTEAAVVDGIGGSGARQRKRCSLTESFVVDGSVGRPLVDGSFFRQRKRRSLASVGRPLVGGSVGAVVIGVGIFKISF